MKKLSLILISLSLSLGIYAQNATDALRYSRMQYSGTARFNAMGGAFGALGGDISSIMINPASLGIYRNSEFTFTANLFSNDLESNYRGNMMDENRMNFNISNIGYVGSYKGDPNGWKNFSFAIGHNRISNFYGDYKYKGTSDANGASIIDGYVNQLNTDHASLNNVASDPYGYPFGPSQGYFLYMIDSVGVGQYDRGKAIENATKIDQYESNHIKGKQAETFFSFGGNYKDRLYLGGSIGIQNANYERKRDYKEDYVYDPIATPNDSVGVGYQESTEQYTSGSGANIKLGAIYRITDGLRIGASIHSPTWFNFTEDYRFQSSSSFSDGANYKEDQVISTYNYRITTPWRYSASLAYVYKDIAAFDVDYEYVDYGTARIKDTPDFEYDYSSSNNGIKNQLKPTQNIRVGAEVRLEPFVIRGGFRYEDNPYSNNTSFNPDESRKTYSIGAGFRAKNYTVDLTYMQSRMNAIDPVYAYNNETASLNGIQSRIMLTLGWKW